jgi:LysR family transcriptional regulator for metE and metH
MRALPNPSLETRDLRLMQAIAEGGGATRAAKLLAVSQSAVSHQLRGLEARLGVNLFERKGRNLRLTSAGDRLVQLSRDLLAPLAQAELELKRGSAPKRVPLRIGSQCYSAYHWLPRAFSTLAELHPEVDLSVVADVADEVPAALEEGRVDLALCLSSPKQRQFVQRRLFRDELVLAVPRGHPLSQRKYVDGADLLTQTLILNETAKSERERVLRALFPRGGRFGRVVRIPITEAVVEMVAAGLGVTIAPSFVLSPYLPRTALHLVRLTPRGLMRDWQGAYRKSSPAAAAMQTLLDIVQQQGIAERSAALGNGKALRTKSG